MAIGLSTADPVGVVHRGLFLHALVRRHGFDIDGEKIAGGEEIAAARASFKQDYGPYRDLLRQADISITRDRELTASSKRQAKDRDDERDC